MKLIVPDSIWLKGRASIDAFLSSLIDDIMSGKKFAAAHPTKRVARKTAKRAKAPTRTKRLGRPPKGVALGKMRRARKGDGGMSAHA
ncbi:MAG TPA: hypothetical protein ENH55_13275 [Aurantimonas coralicida]|uniref:Uncharacterized protein n=2 Tax=root TaxID=1 RepID=A0A9C9NE66_9HYPH|nr:hypothetical protein [Aurantimonas coralicida]HET99668.1 hypothetical protein [Aurantimonas coralicida]